MKKLLLVLLMLNSFSIFAETFEAVGISKQKTIGINLKREAIKDAKKKIFNLCLEEYSEYDCEELEYEVLSVKKVVHRQCGGTIFGPEGRCRFKIVEMKGTLEQHYK